MTENDLIPLAPAEAVEMFIEDKSGEYADSTIQSYGHRLQRLVEWCGLNNVENLNELNGRDLYDYKHWRGDDDLAQASWKTQIDTARTFLHFCESIHAVEDGLAQKLQSPKRDPEKGQHRMKKAIEPEVAQTILERLHQYQYASDEHVQFLLMWRCCFRLGALRALDIGDVDLSGLALEVRHRPESETPLKNKERGERDVAISSTVGDVLEDYIEEKRKDNEDDYGREPLITTRYGRRSGNTMRRTVYKLTRPCDLSGECPEDRDIEECEAANDNHKSYSCPANLNPHAIRRGAITHHLSSDVPKQIVSARADVSKKVLDKHYDVRSEREKMKQRRKWLDSV